MFSIGEFPELTGLTVKTLRYYHEQKLLEPTRVDCGTGYRFHDGSKIELAHSINALRKLGFTIAEIRRLLDEHADDLTTLAFLETRRSAIRSKIESDQATLKLLDSIIAVERQTNDRIRSAGFEVSETEVPPTLVASVRHTGKYEECGKLFGKIGRRFGRHLSGKPMLLCHDEEYRDSDAKFEAAFPIRKRRLKRRNRGLRAHRWKSDLIDASWTIQRTASQLRAVDGGRKRTKPHLSPSIA